MVISETTVRPTDGAVEHPRMDSLRVDEQTSWLASQSGPNLIHLSVLILPFIQRISIFEYFYYLIIFLQNRGVR